MGMGIWINLASVFGPTGAGIVSCMSVAHTMHGVYVVDVQ